MSIYEYKASGLTDIGNVKEVNQDCFSIKAASYNGEKVLFAMVADGMGGTVNGEEASQAIKSGMEKWFRTQLEKAFEEDDDRFEENLVKGWQSTAETVNRRLNNEASFQQAGTTLTMILLYNGISYTANIGDSRIYMMAKDGLYQITEDHSWVQLQLAAGRSMEDIVKDSTYEMNAHKLTRCLGAGVTDSPRLDYKTDTYEAGDTFLLCSDGFVHKTGADELERELRNTNISTRDKIKELIEQAKERGERDNITAVIIKVESTGEALDAKLKEEAGKTFTHEQLAKTQKLVALP